MTQYRDAYRPDDSKHIIIKLTTQNLRALGDWDHNTIESEFLRIPKKGWQFWANLQLYDPFNFDLQLSIADTKALKEHFRPANTDALDEQGKRLPAHSKEEWRQLRQRGTEQRLPPEQIESTITYKNNNKKHSPQSASGKYLPAIIENKNGVLAKAFALNDVITNVTQPSGKIQPGMQGRSKKKSWRAYYNKGVEDNLTDDTGKVVAFAYEEYNEHGQLTERHAKTKGKFNNIVIDNIFYAAKTYANYGAGDASGVTYNFMEDDNYKDMVLEDGTVVPYNVSTNEAGEIVNYRYSDKTPVDGPDHVSFYRGNLEPGDMRWHGRDDHPGLQTGDEEAGITRIELTDTGILSNIDYGDRGRMLTREKLNTLARENVTFFSRLKEKRAELTNSIKKIAGLSAPI